MTNAEIVERTDPRRNLWRAILLLLVTIPALPGIFLFIISLYGKVAGCDVTSAAPCIVGGSSLGAVAKQTLDIAAGFAVFFVFLGGVWLLISLYPIHKSFRNTGARLTAALFIGCWSIAGGIIAGLIGLSSLAPHCSFNEGGVGTCRLFGVDTQSGHQIGTAIWGVMLGLPSIALIWLVYAVVAVIVSNRNKPRTITFPPRS